MPRAAKVPEARLSRPGLEPLPTELLQTYLRYATGFHRTRGGTQDGAFDSESVQEFRGCVALKPHGLGFCWAACGEELPFLGSFSSYEDLYFSAAGLLFLVAPQKTRAVACSCPDCNAAMRIKHHGTITNNINCTVDSSCSLKPNYQDKADRA